MPEHAIWQEAKQQRVAGRKLEATFRGHDFTAWVRKPTLDEEARILAAGLDAKTRSVTSPSSILREYVRTCVTKTDFGLTAKKLEDAKVLRDTDLLWFLYNWLGVADLLSEDRAGMVEAVRGKRTGSSTGKSRTRKPKPSSSATCSDDEE